MATRLFVGGISWDTTQDSLRVFFEQVGKVDSATIITDKYTGKSKGFAFVEMGSEEEAKAAIEKLNGQTLDGRTLVVNEARPQEPRENNFQRGYGGGRNRRDSRGDGRSRDRDSRGRGSY